MNDKETPKDELLFDRLADGELSATERRQLLQSLDHREDGWRQCALALLEAQTWRYQIRELVKDNSHETIASTSLGLRQLVGRKTFWLATAAALTIAAFFLGRAGRHPTPGGMIEDGVIASEQPSTNTLEHQVEADSLSSDDIVTLLVRNADGEPQRLRVPLVDLASLDNQSGPSLPSELQASFRDRGFDLRRRRRFAPMFFEQNQRLVPMVVPVDDTYVVPVDRPIY